jgi:hypothetical protein
MLNSEKPVFLTYIKNEARIGAENDKSRTIQHPWQGE